MVYQVPPGLLAERENRWAFSAPYTCGATANKENATKQITDTINSFFTATSIF